MMHLNIFKSAALASVFSSLLIVSFVSVADAQPQRVRPRPAGEFEVSGTIKSIRPGKMTIADDQGGRRTYLAQDKDEDATTVGGLIMRLPCNIKVEGNLQGKLLEAGMVIKFSGKLNRAGKSQGKITKFDVVDVDSSEWKLDPQVEPKGTGYEMFDIIGRVRYVREKDWKVLLEVPKTKFSRGGRVSFILDPESRFTIKADDLNSVRKGDKVVKMKGIKFSTGEWVAKSVVVEMAEDREKTTFSYHDQLELKYSSLSDEPGDPRSVKSRHFELRTDISDRQAQILLAKLETMYGLIGKYFGRLNPKPITCYVVRDLSKWQNAGLPPRAIAKIAEPAGVTISQIMMNTATGQKKATSIVYSCDNQGVVQHEAVHAICSQAFGDAGPTWYAEGMAEVGQYWKPGEFEVNIDPVAVHYLTNAKKVKPLAEIVKAGQITGDSWEAYCWRWALCHLLANNPNYSGNFKKLGIGMMKEQKGATFEAAYGRFAKEIDFEYQFFCKNFDNGYRVDLCSWNWKRMRSAKPLHGSDFTESTTLAQGGWQPTLLKVEKGKTYEYMNKGTWKIEEGGKELKAAGFSSGFGGMVGMVFTDDYEISETIEMFKDRGTFVAPTDGILFLRCNDDLLELSDNEGEIKTYFRNAPKSSGDSSDNKSSDNK